MHGIGWNHMIPCMESYENPVGLLLSKHCIAWNSTDHIVPCMELHESLMTSDPGRRFFSQKSATTTHSNIADVRFQIYVTSSTNSQSQK